MSVGDLSTVWMLPRTRKGTHIESYCPGARGQSRIPSAVAKGINVEVKVRDNQVEKALRILKRKMQSEGIFREMRAREAYEKPSEEKRRRKAEAQRRHRKDLRKRMEREGLAARAGK